MTAPLPAGTAPLMASGQPHPHESAAAQIAGAATYIDDIPEVRGTLYAAPVLSKVAHGKLRGVDTQAALALPGVHAVLLAADVPGSPMLAAFAGDEPVLARDTVQHVGQVIALVVADSVMLATARAFGATLWTQDEHFEGLPDVRYRPAKTPAGRQDELRGMRGTSHT